MEQCSGPGHQPGDVCGKPAERDGLCRAHRQQKYDGRPLSPLRVQGQTRLQMLRAAALAYADADGDDDFARATNRLIKAAMRYARAGGGRADELSGNPQADGST